MIKKRILVIDDDNAVRTIICDDLLDCGYDVDHAEDGEIGMQIMAGKALPIVITDIIMPCKDGVEVILEIREKYPNVKVLAISGGGRIRTGDYLGLAHRLGSHAILRKPLDMIELEKAVEKLTS